METPSTSIPFGIKDIWHFEYFEREVFVILLLCAFLAGYLIYLAWQRAEKQSSVEKAPKQKPNWKLLYRALSLSDLDFAKRIESLLVEFAYEELRIPLRSSLTAEEKARLVASPDISLCLRLARDIRYSKSEERDEKLQELDRVAGRIFEGHA
jgi:hypothetical protein